MIKLLKFLLLSIFMIDTASGADGVATSNIPFGVADDSKKGLEIASEYKRRDSGFLSVSVQMQMELINSRGQTSVRHLRTRAYEFDEGDIGEKRLLIFDKPLDVRGTVLLTSSHKIGSDQQWLYLPAVKRVKRITANNKTGPFVGSEFSYEDLSAFSVEKYSYSLLGISECGEAKSCFQLERVPKDPDTGYTRHVIWIDQEEYRLWRVEYYDRRNQLLKVLDINGYKKYQDRFWRPSLMVMSNEQTDKKTVLHWKDYEFGSGGRRTDYNASQISKIR